MIIKNTSSQSTDAPPDEDEIEAFIRFAIIYYARGVLQNRFQCTPEWRRCAKHVLKEVVK